MAETSGPVADVVRDIVAEEAPDELPVADGLARLGDDRAVRRLASRRRREPLGSGLGEVVPRARELALEYGHERKDAEALAERLVARVVLRPEGTR